MTQSIKRRARRLKIMEIDPNCYWCRKPLKESPIDKEKPGTVPEDYPTLDHLNTKHGGKRAGGNNKKGSTPKEATVLSCLKCNSFRGQIDTKLYNWNQKLKSIKLT